MTTGWYLSRVGELCGSCRQRIPAASPARRLKTGRVRCVDCALAQLHETPPATLVQVAPPTPAVTPPDPKNGARWRPLQPFVEQLRRRLQPPAVDVKHAAAGDDTHD